MICKNTFCTLFLAVRGRRLSENNVQMNSQLLLDTLKTLNDVLPDAWEWREQFYVHERINGVLFLEVGKNKQSLAVEIRHDLRGHQLSQILRLKNELTGEQLLLLAERITQKQKEWLKTHSINHIDGAGNIWLKVEGLILIVEGKKKEVLGKSIIGRAFTKSGLKVVFVLLAFPAVIQKSYREIAALAGVSIDTVSKVFKSLDQNGYIVRVDEQTRRLSKKEVLLNHWIIQYGQRLRPNLIKGRFKAISNRSIDQQIKTLNASESFWGGEVAADILTNYLRPEEFVLYTKESLNELLFRLKLVPSSDGNIWIYEKFWTWPSKITNPKTVPPILVYADLMLTEDPRNEEAAQLIYDEYIQKKL